MYKIKSTKVEGVNFSAEVDYTLKDGSVINAHVDIFSPASKEDVITAIASRGETEQKMIEAEALNEQIKSEIDKDIADKIL